MIKKLITVSILLSLNACVFTATGSIGPIKQNTDSNQSSNTSSSNSNSEPSQLKDIAVKEVQAIPDQLVMVEGNKLKATANVVYVDNSRNSDISWSSSDNTIAVVSKTGKVTALKKGKVTIVATYNLDISYKAVSLLEVIDN